MLLHGHARSTSDLDILVEASEENARRLVCALASWGEGAGAELALTELTTPAMGALRVIEDFNLDIFTQMRSRTLDREFTYNDFLPGSQVTTLSNGVKVAYLSIQQLVDLKADTGREKDRGDIEILSEVRSGQRPSVAVDLANSESLPAGSGSSGDEDWPV